MAGLDAKPSKDGNPAKKSSNFSDLTNQKRLD
jgi:hypothetical protein